MSLNKMLYRFTFFFLMSVMTVSCVTETIESPGMKFTETAVVSVQDPNIFVAKASTIAWLPEAVRFYKDKRLQDAPVRKLIEKEIIENLIAKEMVYVDSVNGARYAIAYTAALESSLDDAAIIRNFGLLPGNTQVPQGDANIEKGSLIIYVFDNKTADIIWRSAAQVSVKFDTPVEEREKRIGRVLSEMFQSFTVGK